MIDQTKAIRLIRDTANLEVRAAREKEFDALEALGFTVNGYARDITTDHVYRITGLGIRGVHFSLRGRRRRLGLTNEGDWAFSERDSHLQLLRMLPITEEEALRP